MRHIEINPAEIPIGCNFVLGQLEQKCHNWHSVHQEIRQWQRSAGGSMYQQRHRRELLSNPVSHMVIFGTFLVSHALFFIFNYLNKEMLLHGRWLSHLVNTVTCPLIHLQIPWIPHDNIDFNSFNNSTPNHQGPYVVFTIVTRFSSVSVNIKLTIFARPFQQSPTFSKNSINNYQTVLF